MVWLVAWRYRCQVEIVSLKLIYDYRQPFLRHAPSRPARRLRELSHPERGVCLREVSALDREVSTLGRCLPKRNVRLKEMSTLIRKESTFQREMCQASINVHLRRVSTLERYPPSFREVTISYIKLAFKLLRKDFSECKSIFISECKSK